MKSVSSVSPSTESNTITAADQLYLYALKCSELLWDEGFYTKAIYLNENARTYKAARDRLGISDLIS